MSQSSSKSLLFNLVPIFVIALIIGGFFLLRGGDKGSGKSGARSLSPDEELGRGLVSGRDYAVWVSRAVMRPRMPDDNKWDAIEGSAPDPYVHIIWRENKVFKSETVENQLVAHWMRLGINLTDALGGVTPSGVGRHAIVEYVPGEQLEVVLRDADAPMQAMSEGIAHALISMDDLREGANKLMEVPIDQGVESITLMVSSDTRQISGAISDAVAGGSVVDDGFHHEVTSADWQAMEDFDLSSFAERAVEMGDLDALGDITERYDDLQGILDRVSKFID